MLPSLKRLHSKADFQQVYIRGKTLNTRFFRIKTVANELSHSRFGVVVPNKLIKKAVERNKKKRQVRAALVALHPRVIPGYDVALMAQPAIVDASYEEIVNDIQQGFAKIRFIAA